MLWALVKARLDTTQLPGLSSPSSLTTRHLSSGSGFRDPADTAASKADSKRDRAAERQETGCLLLLRGAGTQQTGLPEAGPRAAAREREEEAAAAGAPVGSARGGRAADAWWAQASFSIPCAGASP